VRAINKVDILHLLRAAVKREGGQVAFAERHGINRVSVNKALNGERPASSAIAKALGLRREYVIEEDVD
jgi:hypothetical protein